MDRAPGEQLREHYPEFRDHKLVPVSVVADAQTLSAVSDESQDFVIASHVIEHMEDPILAIQNWLRVLRPNGVIYLVVPDKRFTFDAFREVTCIEHLERDHREGPQTSRRDHYREWAAKVMGVEVQSVERCAQELEQKGTSIHYHMWGTPMFIRFLLHLRAAWHFPFEIELVRRNGNETIVVLAKTDAAPVQNQN